MVPIPAIASGARRGLEMDCRVTADMAGFSPVMHLTLLSNSSNMTQRAQGNDILHWASYIYTSGSYPAAYLAGSISFLFFLPPSLLAKTHPKVPTTVFNGSFSLHRVTFVFPFDNQPRSSSESSNGPELF